MINKCRIEKIFNLQNALNATAVLITDSITCKYLTGLNSSNIAILFVDKKITILTDFRYKDLVENFCKENKVSAVIMEKGLSTELSKILANNSKIAIQSNYMTIDLYNEIKNKNTTCELISAGSQIDDIFCVKTENEISSIQKAAEIADKSLDEVYPKIKNGMTEFELAELLDATCKINGSESPSFETIVLFGERSAMPHGRPSKNRILKDGDIILIDFGCTINGFCSDMTRTFSISKVNEKLKEIYLVVQKAQIAGKIAVKAGKTASEIDIICREIINSEGFGEYFGHATGHAVGLRIHETPSIKTGNETLLSENMIITIEPGIYISDVGGVRIEDLIQVTNEGAISLSKNKIELQF